MPLSKKRDRQRKRLGKQETDRIRLEKLASSPQTSKPVQWDDVIDTTYYAKTQVKLVTRHYKVTELDADGNPIPEL